MCTYRKINLSSNSVWFEVFVQTLADYEGVQMKTNTFVKSSICWGSINYLVTDKNLVYNNQVLEKQ